MVKFWFSSLFYFGKYFFWFDKFYPDFYSNDNKWNNRGITELIVKIILKKSYVLQYYWNYIEITEYQHKFSTLWQSPYGKPFKFLNATRSLRYFIIIFSYYRHNRYQ